MFPLHSHFPGLNQIKNILIFLIFFISCVFLFFLIIFLKFFYWHIDCISGGGVLRFELDRGVQLKPQNPYPSVRVILAKKGTHF